jgi:hypothetical protein
MAIGIIGLESEPTRPSGMSTRGGSPHRKEGKNDTSAAKAIEARNAILEHTNLDPSPQTQKRGEATFPRAPKTPLMQSTR